MESGIWTIIGTVIGIVGTLSTQFFSTLYDKEKTNKQISRKIIEDKYNNFKKSYKEYKYSYANLQNCCYNTILKKASLNDRKKIIEPIEKIYNSYYNVLSTIFDILDEDDYIAEELIEYKELKSLYIDIIEKLGFLNAEIFLWKYLNDSNKEKILETDKEFISLCNTMEEQLQKLNHKLQKLLYQNIIKNC